MIRELRVRLEPDLRGDLVHSLVRRVAEYDLPPRCRTQYLYDLVNFFGASQVPTSPYTVEYSLDPQGPYRVEVEEGDWGYAVWLVYAHTPENTEPSLEVCFLPPEWEGERIRREIVSVQEAL